MNITIKHKALQQQKVPLTFLHFFCSRRVDDHLDLSIILLADTICAGEAFLEEYKLTLCLPSLKTGACFYL